MPSRSVRVSILLFVALLLMITGLPPAVPVPTSIAPLLVPPVAQAQTADGGNYGSDVPCLEAQDQFATTCFVLADNSLTPNPNDPALVRFNTGGKSPLANLGQLGSTYALAYDDGRLSGVRRLFVSAYAKRLADFGPLGPGGIYEVNLTTGVVRNYATVGGTTNRHNAASFDQAMADWVGKSSLGDMEMGPGGSTLYVTNLDTRQIARFNVAGATPTALAPLTLDLNLISTSATVQADLRPFGLEFLPRVAPATDHVLAVGLVDSAERGGAPLRLYVIFYNIFTGAQTLALVQDLSAPEIGTRSTCGGGWQMWDFREDAWGAGGASSGTACHPQPMLSDIEFSGDGNTMFVGLRDRTGDQFFSRNPPAPYSEALAQGDTLVYRRSGGAWTLQTSGGAAPTSDYFEDNYVGSSLTESHRENQSGALTSASTGTGGSLGRQILSTAITPFVPRSSGVNWYSFNPYQRERVAAIELIPEGTISSGKAASLGDLENLCTSALIGDRVWRDSNGNGVQEAGESGVGGVLVELLRGGAVVATATTDANGLYYFSVQPGQSYTLRLAASNFTSGGALNGLIITPQNRSGDDTLDSDADQISGTIAVAPQDRDEVNLTFDFGVMLPVFANGVVGDFVWSDNGNGVQDASETGVSGVTVRLIDTSDGSVRSTSTNSSGFYQFINIVPGTYQVEFTPPAGVGAAPRDTGGNDSLDSDADAATGWRTPAFTVVADTDNRTLDLGLLMGANVRVSKTGATTVLPTQSFAYTLSWANDGPAIANSVQLVDTLPAGVTFVSASPAPSNISGQNVTWNLGNQASGAAGSITVTVTVHGNAPASLVNNASISTTSTGDGPGDNTTTWTTTVIRPNVYVDKSGPVTATVGDQFSYTLAYGNNGTANAGGVQLVDTLPAGLSYVSASPAPSSVSGQTVTWNLGTVTAGGSGSITVNVRSAASAANGTIVVNGVAISTTTPGDTPGDNSDSTSTTLQRSDVYVTKSSSTSFPVVSGQAVTYFLDYGNNGPASAVNVSLTDQVPAQLTGVTWACVSGCAASGSSNSISVNLGTLAAGATGRIQVTGTATTSLAREDFTNTAVISTTTPETRTDNNTSSVPGAVWTSDVQVIKLAQPQVVAGNTFTATLSYRNNGPAPAANATLVDTLPTGITFVSASPAPSSVSGQTITWNLGTLADSAGGTIQLVLVSDPAIANNTTVTNRAAISTGTTDRDAGNNQNQADTLLISRADTSLTKTGPARVSAGDGVTFTISYTNAGPSVARGVVISDTLPAELDYVSANPAPTSNAGGVLTWNLGDVGPGQGGTITVQMQSRYDQALPALDATNSAQISSATQDDNPADCCDDHTTAVETVDLSIVKDMPPFAVAGVPFTATLTYANAGPADALSVTLRDLLPPGLTLLQAIPAPTGPGLRWNLGSVTAGTRGTIQLVLRAAPNTPTGTRYTNTALIDTTSSDRDPSNDTSSDTTEVRPNADLVVVKEGTPGPLRSGSAISYTITYRNDGPSLARSIVISDTLPAGFSITSATPAPAQNSGGLLTWNLGDLNPGASGAIQLAGTITGNASTTRRVNVAAIGSPTDDPDTNNNDDDHPIDVLRPDLSIFKTDGVTDAEPGDELTYTLTIRNTGPISATNVVLTETPPAPITDVAWTAQGNGSYTLPIGTVAAGATITRSVTIRLPNPLTTALLTRIVNTASVREPCCDDPTPGDNTSTDIDTPIAGRIGDTIWLDKNGDGLQGEGEPGLANVPVELLDPTSGQVLATTTTDAQGHYHFSGLHVGQYAVRINPGALEGVYHDYAITTAPIPIGTLTSAALRDDTLDIGLQQTSPTAIVLAYLLAEPLPRGTLIRWGTLAEHQTSHFRVERSTRKDRSDAVLVGIEQSKGSRGGDYRVLDASAPASGTVYYWLIEVETDGDQTVYGPAFPKTQAMQSLAYLPFVRR